MNLIPTQRCILATSLQHSLLLSQNVFLNCSPFFSQLFIYLFIYYSVYTNSAGLKKKSYKNLGFLTETNIFQKEKQVKF